MSARPIHDHHATEPCLTSCLAHGLGDNVAYQGQKSVTAPDLTPEQAAEHWATIAFALARDVNRLKTVCTQDHPPKMGSPTRDWEPGTETRHSDGTRCVLLEDGDYAILSADLRGRPRSG